MFYLNSLISFSLLFSIAVFSGCSSSADWRTASRESANIAPLPSEVEGAIFQIYYARAFDWRGHFGIHPWVAWKEAGDESYTVSQVVGWRARRGESAVVVAQDKPDRHWFNNPPYILFEVEGEQAEAIISRVKELIESYPYTHEYRLWPGPNSNTYIAYLIRHTSEIKIELPAHAIGKDWLVESSFFAPSPSATGLQFSLLGAFGLTVGLGEGIELNLLGLNFGVDFWTPALKLPFVGRLGFADRPL